MPLGHVGPATIALVVVVTSPTMMPWPELRALRRHLPGTDALALTRKRAVTAVLQETASSHLSSGINLFYPCLIHQRPVCADRLGRESSNLAAGAARTCHPGFMSQDLALVGEHDDFEHLAARRWRWLGS